MYQVRHLGLLDIDEAGYLSFSRTHYLALIDQGFGGFLNSVGHQHVFAPLIPALGALFQFFAGGNILAALAVNPILWGVTALSVYFTARYLAGELVAWIAGLLLIAIPGLFNASWSFHFAVGVAAFFALALYFAMRSRNFASWTFTMLMGASLGFMMLSRTMAVAFAPGFFIAALVIVLMSREQIWPKLWRLFASGITMLTVAATWYLPNASGVLKYLTSFGYGKQSTVYGADNGGLLDIQSWFAVIGNFVGRCLGYVLGTLVMVGLLLFVLRLISGLLPTRFHVFGTALKLRPDFVLLTLVLLWQVACLASTRNSGSDFWIALPPPITILCAIGLAYLAKRWQKILAISLSAAMAVTSLAFNNGLFGWRLIEVSLFPGDSVVLVDSRPGITQYLSGGWQNSSNAGISEMNRDWDAPIEALTKAIHILAPNQQTAFAFRHAVVNTNTVELRYSLRWRQNFRTSMINPVIVTNTPARFDRWITLPHYGNPCLILTSEGIPGEFSPYIDQTMLQAAATKAGYRVVKTIDMPGTRVIKVWASDAICEVVLPPAS